MLFFKHVNEKYCYPERQEGKGRRNQSFTQHERDEWFQNLCLLNIFNAPPSLTVM